VSFCIWVRRPPRQRSLCLGLQCARAETEADENRFRRICLLENVNWAWGLSLIVLTAAIHATGVVMMALVGFKIRASLETRKLRLRYMVPIAIGIVGASGLLLALPHGVEAAIWTAAYVWLGALDSLQDAILYSVDPMTTRGASGLLPQQRWRMMGVLEAADSKLLFGINTAYIFAVMQAYWPMLSERICQGSRQATHLAGRGGAGGLRDQWGGKRGWTVWPAAPPP
jgi:hypothetical protein